MEPSNLDRFVVAQLQSYHSVVEELNSGKKKTHWMWYIFPQIEGLGSSPLSKKYAIKSLDEAKAYYNHNLLGKRLLECSKILLNIDGKGINEIFAYPDNIKLQSSMTLFVKAAPSENIFQQVIEKYFDGKLDDKTLEKTLCK
ncbi:MAG: hypothetical protein S4CHLAM6_12520 [Chlamydiae bacterium]|nr:hypothetical protein [Chlamydiota bacterium]